jgi:V/A-type H+/Na+-transporting ATPase subunit C
VPDDFSYLNARVRVRRARLLPEGFFREALHLNFPELLKVFSESIYAADLTGDTLADVDRAVTVHFNRTAADLPRLVSGKAREAVSLLLIRADLANVKTILRGKNAGWSTDDIVSQLGGGTLPRALYSTLAAAPDAASMAQLLSLRKHPMAAALRESSRPGHQPLEMEVALDRAFYSMTLRRARELDQPYLASFLRVEVDALNLATGLKLFTIGFEGLPTPFFLKGGRCVSFPLFQRLARGELAAFEQLSDTDFKRVAEVRGLPALERGLRCILLAKAREGVKDVLGVGLALDYIQRKMWEAGRIRLLTRRAYYNLPPASVEKEMICE